MGEVISARIVKAEAGLVRMYILLCYRGIPLGHFIIIVPGAHSPAQNTGLITSPSLINGRVFSGVFWPTWRARPENTAAFKSPSQLFFRCSPRRCVPGAPRNAPVLRGFMVINLLIGASANHEILLQDVEIE